MARDGRIQLVVVIVLSVLMGTGGSLARASSTPVQGIYEYCAPAQSPDGCIGRLRTIAAGGFRVVLNYALLDSSSGQLQRYMNAAAASGVKLIWPMKDTPWWGHGRLAIMYPQLAQSCGCATNDAFLRYVVTLAKNSRSTWGYYIADEQAPAEAAQITAFSRRLRALDPDHPRLAVAAGEDSVASLLTPYAGAADVVGADSYPVGTGQPLERVSFVSRAAQAVARANGLKSAMVIQAFDWARYPQGSRWPQARWPTSREMRTMLDLVTQGADPSLVLWYSYFDVRDALAPDCRWRDLIWAAFGTGTRVNSGRCALVDSLGAPLAIVTPSGGESIATGPAVFLALLLLPWVSERIPAGVPMPMLSAPRLVSWPKSAMRR
jgi:hypothetical protein